MYLQFLLLNYGHLVYKAWSLACNPSHLTSSPLPLTHVFSPMTPNLWTLHLQNLASDPLTSDLYHLTCYLFSKNPFLCLIHMKLMNLPFNIRRITLTYDLSPSTLIRATLLFTSDLNYVTWPMTPYSLNFHILNSNPSTLCSKL